MTKKDHFLWSFLDQVLEKVVVEVLLLSKWLFWLLYQIKIALGDQEKTTFTILFAHLLFQRMSFWTWNAPAAVQRCMLSIFSERVEYYLEVFMDEFSAFGNNFEFCLTH